MKEKKLSFVLSILFVACSISHSNAINFMPTLETGKFKTGIELSFGKQDFDSDDGQDECDISRYFFGGEYAINNQFSVYGVIGLTDFKNNDFKVQSSDGWKEFEPDPGLSYGLGLKAAFVEEKNYKFGMSLQITKFSIDKETISNPYGYIIGEDDYFHSAFWTYGYSGEAEGMAYNICIGGSYQNDMKIVFYGGLYFSKIDIDFTLERSALAYKDFDGFDKLSSYGQERFINSYNERLAENGFTSKTQEKTYDSGESDPIGLVLGGTYCFYQRFEVGLEARFINETSFAISGIIDVITFSDFFRFSF